MNNLNLNIARHCGLAPQSTTNRGKLKQVQYGVKVFILATVIVLNACGDWLDVVPEGVATIDMAFNSRRQTLKYLGTCYSYLPKDALISANPALLGSDELTSIAFFPSIGLQWDAVNIALGMQNATNPLLGNWYFLYQSLRDCNTFLDNAHKVPDLPAWERDQWMAEVLVLKAYYHFLLVRMYGPIPIIRENLPVGADVTTVKTVREPVDDCFQYIVELLDEATSDNRLPQRVLAPQEELGRITKPIALALKAKILVTAASPLFNGNDQQATLRNHDGTQLFNTTYDVSKWQKAVNACKEAIDACHDANIELYKFPNSGVVRLTDTIATQMSLRCAFTERWNSEIIWANTQSLAGNGLLGLQEASAPRLNPDFISYPNIHMYMRVPLKIAEMFYTHNGVPLEEDKTRNFSERYALRTAQEVDKLYVKNGSVTVDMHFDREPRFYAYVGFDCGIWFGAGRIDDKAELWSTGFKIGQTEQGTITYGPYTGYIPKKFVHYTNMITSITNYSYTPYPWPIMRLSDLYLLYAEAINEAEGPNGPNSAEMFEYINRVRERAGLKGVKESWDQYAIIPKYDNPTGMRQIIQQERMIELAFECQRFYDVRRWKIAPEVYQKPIDGWSCMQSETVAFYTPMVLYNYKFGIRDYFWPISNASLLNNPNLVQNIGW